VARAIIRYSLDDDYGNANGNQLRMALEAARQHSKAPNLPMDEVLTSVADLISRLSELPDAVQLDHLWIYVDEPDPSPAMPRPASWQG
jgi:hypothetical protein